LTNEKQNVFSSIYWMGKGMKTKSVVPAVAVAVVVGGIANYYNYTTTPV